MRNSNLASAVICVLATGLAGAAPHALAQNADNDVLRRTQLQLRQSEQERNSLRGEVARLQSQLGGQVSELDKLRQQTTQVLGKQDSSAAELNARTGKLNQATRALKDTQDELAQLRARNERQTQAVQNVQAMLQTTQKTLAERDELVGLCRTRNQELYSVGTQILSMYQDKDFHSVSKREPVLQLQQVKLQNLAQDFEDRLRQQRVYEDTLPPSVEKAMQESLRKEAAGTASTTNSPPG